MANRQIDVFIYNSTNYDFEFMESHLDSGSWVFQQAPPATIPLRGSGYGFKVEAFTIANRISGWVRYKIVGQPDSYFWLKFENPIVGSNNAVASIYSSKALLSCDVHASKGNAGSVSVKIHDHVDGIIVYEHANFGGQFQYFGIGNHDLAEFKNIKNDQISSIQVAGGTKVRVFEHQNFVNEIGSYITGTDVQENIAYVGDSLNDKISSLIVEYDGLAPIQPKPPSNTEYGLNGVILYEHANYNQGLEAGTSLFGRKRSSQFGEGSFNLDSGFFRDLRGHIVDLGSVGPNQLSSMKIGTGYVASIFDARDQSGNFISISNNMPNLPPEWNDRAVSISVMRVSSP